MVSMESTPPSTMVSTGGAAEAGATTPESGATTPGAGGATTPGAGGATTLGAGGATTPGAGGSTTPAALVETKIAAVIASASGRRMKRQETPTTCATFQTMVGDMNTAISKSTDAGYAEATKLEKLLAAVDAATVGCTSDDVAALNTAKSEVTAAKAVAEADSNAQQSLIQKAIEKINAAIAIINEVNALLLAAGQSTLADPGTTLATVTVPSLATDAAAGGATTAAGGAGETTPGGGAGATTPGTGAGVTTPGAGAGESTPAGGAGETTPAA